MSLFLMELVGSLGTELYVFWLSKLCSPVYPLLPYLPPCLQ